MARANTDPVNSKNKLLSETFRENMILSGDFSACLTARANTEPAYQNYKHSSTMVVPRPLSQTPSHVLAHAKMTRHTCPWPGLRTRHISRKKKLKLNVFYSEIQNLNTPFKQTPLEIHAVQVTKVSCRELHQLPEIT